MRPPKSQRPAGTGRQVELHNELHDAGNVPQAALARQVSTARLIARCLDAQPVYVGDRPLEAELFDRRGRLIASHGWRP